MERRQYHQQEAAEEAFVDAHTVSASCPHAECSAHSAARIIEADFCCPDCGTPAIVRALDGTMWVSWGASTGYAEEVILPELPRVRRQRFVEEYGINRETASKLTVSKERGDFFETVTAETGHPNTAATFIADLLFGELKYRDLTITAVSADDVTDLVTALATETITERKATEVVRTALDTQQAIDSVFAETDTQKTESDTLASIAAQIVDEEEGAVEDYRSGDDEALNYLVGQVMARTEGAADAREARETFKSLLDETEE